MPFPLTVGSVVVPDPGALAVLVREELAAPRVVPGRRPAAWVAELAASGALETRLAVGLAAAMVQNPDPGTICEGARLAGALGHRILGPVLVKALAAHDASLLLQVDPAGDGASVEDTLLSVVPQLADLADPEVRGPLLAYLRHAGLPELEVPILAEHGDPAELRTWLPAILAEGLSPDARAHLERRAARDDPGARVVAECLRG